MLTLQRNGVDRNGFGPSGHSIAAVMKPSRNPLKSYGPGKQTASFPVASLQKPNSKAMFLLQSQDLKSSLIVGLRVYNAFQGSNILMGSGFYSVHAWMF